MNDWAEKKAIELLSGHDSGGIPDLDYETLAEELRKTRADGLQQAAHFVRNLKGKLNGCIDPLETVALNIEMAGEQIMRGMIING